MPGSGPGAGGTAMTKTDRQKCSILGRLQSRGKSDKRQEARALLAVNKQDRMCTRPSGRRPASYHLAEGVGPPVHRPPRNSALPPAAPALGLQIPGGEKRFLSIMPSPPTCQVPPSQNSQQWRGLHGPEKGFEDELNLDQAAAGSPTGLTITSLSRRPRRNTVNESSPRL